MRTHCLGCDRPLWRYRDLPKPDGYMHHAGADRCGRCYQPEHEWAQPSRPTTEQNRAALAAWITKRRENWPDDGTLKGVVP